MKRRCVTIVRTTRPADGWIKLHAHSAARVSGSLHPLRLHRAPLHARVRPHRRRHLLRPPRHLAGVLGRGCRKEDAARGLVERNGGRTKRGSILSTRAELTIAPSRRGCGR
jgi:hypothetical protein